MRVFAHVPLRGVLGSPRPWESGWRGVAGCAMPGWRLQAEKHVLIWGSVSVSGTHPHLPLRGIPTSSRVPRPFLTPWAPHPVPSRGPQPEPLLSAKCVVKTVSVPSRCLHPFCQEWPSASDHRRPGPPPHVSDPHSELGTPLTPPRRPEVSIRIWASFPAPPSPSLLPLHLRVQRVPLERERKGVCGCYSSLLWGAVAPAQPLEAGLCDASAGPGPQALGGGRRLWDAPGSARNT